MATIVSYNGSNFSIPANREPRGWGSSLTSFLLEVAEASLTPSGGNYRLQADLNLGSDGVTPSSFGLVALYYKSVTANIAQSGQLRLARADTIAWRSTTNTDLPLGVSASDRLQFDSVNIPTISSTDTLTNKTLTSPVINSPTGLVKADVGLGNVDNTSDANKPISTATQTALDLKANLVNPTFDDGVTMLHESTPSNPSSGRIRVYPKSDNRLYTLDSSGVETVVGSGAAGGFVNYITNPDAESSTTGWSTYADAAASTPADGTGGSPNVTWTRNTSSPIRGNADFAFAKDAANRQGQGVSFAFTLATTDRSKKCQISFDYDTSAANYAAGDMRVYVYDVTNATLITPQTVDIPKGTNTFVTTFDTTTSTSYRLILHVATTNATAYTVDFDNFVVNAGQVTQGAAISEWQSYTPTVNTGTWTNTRGYYRRNGSTLELNIYAGPITANGSGVYTWSLPSGLTADLTSLGASGVTPSLVDTDGGSNTFVYVGQALLNAQGGVFYGGGATGSLTNPQTVLASTTSVAVVASSTATASRSDVLGSNNGLATVSGVIQIQARIPIAEWAGNGTVNLGPGAQVEYASNSGTSTTTDTTTANFAYGPAGSPIRAFAPSGVTAVTKRIGFQYPIQDDDQIFVEFSTSNGGWAPAGQSSNVPAIYTRNDAGSTAFGVLWRRVSGQPNQLDVEFYSAPVAGDTWSGASAFNWRVRKAKASSPVGFGRANSTEFGLVAPRRGQQPLIVTSTQAGWTTTRAVGIYYQDQDGNHRLKFNISGSITSATFISATQTITGVTFKNVSGYAGACCGVLGGNTTITPNVFSSPNTGNVVMNSASAAGVTALHMSGDVELESRPTWA